VQSSSLPQFAELDELLVVVFLVPDDSATDKCRDRLADEFMHIIWVVISGSMKVHNLFTERHAERKIIKVYTHTRLGGRSAERVVDLRAFMICTETRARQAVAFTLGCAPKYLSRE
jgi:hypothetical protein